MRTEVHFCPTSKPFTPVTIMMRSKHNHCRETPQIHNGGRENKCKQGGDGQRVGFDSEADSTEW